MRVLVTGASGFIGSEVIRQLAARGHSARAVEVRFPEFGIPDDVETYDSVIHCGWLGVAGADRNNLMQPDNISMAIQLLDMCVEYGIRNFIGIGSHAEYGQHLEPMTEQTLTRPTTLYGAAKLATYHLLDRLAAIHGIRFAWARVFNAYGPGDNPSWLIPSTINKLLRGERVSLTACEQIWEYTHVKDVAAGIVALAESPAAGVFNLSSNDPWSLGGVVRHIAQIVGESEDRVLSTYGARERLLGFGEVDYRPDQVMRLENGSRALQNATGWVPRIWLSQGLHETVAWHRENMK